MRSDSMPSVFGQQGYIGEQDFTIRSRDQNPSYCAAFAEYYAVVSIGETRDILMLQ